MVNDFTLWDLVLFDSRFQERGRLKGEGKGPLDFFKSVYTRTADDSRFVVWLNGRNSLSVVDTTDMSAKCVRGFWEVQAGRESESSEPVAVCTSKDGRMVLGVGEKKTGGQTLHLFGRTGVVSVYEMRAVLGNGRTL